MNDQVSVLGFSGSQRLGSYNLGALRAAQDLAPDGMRVELYDLTALPMYDFDLEREGFPEAVRDFKEAIGRADAILIATPEYNLSVPALLKNALDWASRPPGQSPLNGKPAAIMGATAGTWGTIRAQMALRQICLNVNVLVLNKPEVLIARAGEKFDPDGRLIDEATRQLIRALLIALMQWTKRLCG